MNDQELSSALRDLARAHRILDLEGHNDMSLGHLSLRDPLGRGLWLKRGNIGLEEVMEGDFILIDFDGDVLEGDGIRHLEWPIHAEILRGTAGNQRGGPYPPVPRHIAFGYGGGGRPLHQRRGVVRRAASGTSN